MLRHRILTYANINKAKIDLMFKTLIARGVKITGQNPWNINTYYHGVVLRAEWNEAATTLTVSITHSNWYVPRETICETIDSLMQDIQELETA
jgi:hypothetical protein